MTEQREREVRVGWSHLQRWRKEEGELTWEKVKNLGHWDEMS